MEIDSSEVVLARDWAGLLSFFPRCWLTEGSSKSTGEKKDERGKKKKKRGKQKQGKRGRKKKEKKENNNNNNNK